MRSFVRTLLLLLCTLSLSAQAQTQAQAVVWVVAYGPFAVLNEQTAALIGSTDWRSPASFRAMMRDHPHVALLVFYECPGTRDDASNLELGRLIRAVRLDAYVPPGASVRSGAVDLLIATRRRQIDDGARFAVHAWRDRSGHEASDFAAGSSVHRKYLSYYTDMGMSSRQAAAFYAMTNSAPNRSARLLTAAEMRGWIAPDTGAAQIVHSSVK